MAILQQQQRPMKQKLTEPIICKMKDTPIRGVFCCYCGPASYVRTRVNLRHNERDRPQRTQFCTYHQRQSKFDFVSKVWYNKMGIIIYIKNTSQKRGSSPLLRFAYLSRLAAAARFCSLIASSRAILRAFSSAAFAALAAFSSTLRAQSAAISYPS